MGGRWMLALWVAMSSTGCYDAHPERATADPREPPAIQIEPGDVVDRLPPSPPRAGAAASPPVAGAPAPPPFDEEGCLNGAPGVFDGDFDTSAWHGPSLDELEGIREVTGMLTLAQTDSTHFDELHCLRKAGSLHVMRNSRLESLRGLARLEEVPGFVYVTRNPRLRDLRGLAALHGAIGREPHDRCRDVAGCASGALAIEENAALETLAGLESIEEVLGGVSIRNNPALRDLHGLAGIERITGRLRVFNDDALVGLTGLSALTRVERDVEIAWNDALREIGSELPLREIGGLLHVEANAALRSLSGLSSLERVGRLGIVQNPSLRDLSGLEGLTEVTRELWIEGNPELESIAALGSVRGQVGTAPEADFPFPIERQIVVTIAANPVLRSLDGLQAIERVGGTMLVQTNDALQSLTGLDGLVAVHEALEISDNAALLTLDGLQALRRVGRSLNVYRNPRLRDASGLASLEHVGALLDLQSNPVLVEVDLPSLRFARSVALP